MKISQKMWDVMAESLSLALTERDKALNLLHDIDVHLGKHGWNKALPSTDDMHNRIHEILLERGKKKSG